MIGAQKVREDENLMKELRGKIEYSSKQTIVEFTQRKR